MTSLAVGDIIDNRYRIDRPVARGGMSTVYRCVDLRLGRAVAAKVLHDHLSADPVFVQRFRREARAMAQLSHPHLVGIQDFSADAQPMFLIMDLITGGTLRELLAERGPMPPHATAAVLRQVLTGLEAVHARGLIHRDIKPDNILIDGDHSIKLGDFGLVRATASGDTTTSNTIVGTVSYLAPEQVTGEELTPATDVYSLGVVAFELLTGTVPFRGDTPLNHALARLSEDVPAPSSRIAGVPPLFDELVANACARDPQARFADAAEFHAAVADVAAELDLPEFLVPVPRDSAAGRTAAQPTDFSGLRADDFAATSVLSTDSSAQTLVSPPAETRPTEPRPPEPRPETALLPPYEPAVETPIAPAQSPREYSPAQAGYSPAAGPSPSLNPPHSPEHIPELRPASNPVAAHSAQEEPLPKVLSNRSPLLLIAWILAVTALCTALAVGGWWFGSGNYEMLPQLWR
ncbi:protein kinase [Corynebacterium lizhenjunii]|uniref:non-specific serine/threonine protein kinase n=1 Tax=Corynebacterium lizhenjunii TaxID=2709394 RepID=A0A7T0KD13_9CORY|nr:protein kinase [Corynebacterium lizhenjunii]QPK78518.1 protein kinase [Corynebacterium lizhenjunii]